MYSLNLELKAKIYKCFLLLSISFVYTFCDINSYFDILTDRQLEKIEIR